MSGGYTAQVSIAADHLLTRSISAAITNVVESEAVIGRTVRIGLLTSGGDAPGMNAAIAGACARAEELGGHAVGIEDGFAGLAARRAVPVSALTARAHLDEPGTWLGTSRWPRLREPEGRRACRAALRELQLDGLVVIGGHGSALGARAVAAPDGGDLAAGGLPVAFVPATIDRDIAGTELTIGMDSAIAYGADAVDRLRVTGRSLKGRGFLLQTLGAPHGYLADAVAAAAGVDHVLVPERPYDIERIAHELAELAAVGEAIAVMSEAVGDAVRLAEALATAAGIRVHPTILGHAQRAATPSALDRGLGLAAGRAAVEVVARGASAAIRLAADGTVAPAPLNPETLTTRSESA
jgi:6-phosphofructokinase 1